MTLLALTLCLSLLAGPGGRAEDEFLAGEEAFRAGDTAVAEYHYRKAIENDPDHLRAIIRLATVLSWRDRLPEARSLYERAAKMDPGNREARLGLARVASWQGDFPFAIARYRDLRAENPGDREGSIGLARTLGWAGQYRESKEIYLQALSDNPNDIEARNGLAAVLSWEGRLDDSLALYEETLKIDPASREALSGRARVLKWQGRTPQAWVAVGDALKVNPSDRDALTLDAAIHEVMTPVVDAWAGVLHDTDKNGIDMQHVGMSYPITPAASVGGAYDRFDADQPQLHGRLETLKGIGTVRIGKDLALSGSAGVDRILDDASRATVHVTASAGADYRIDDRWSVSGSLSRETYPATALSLDNDVGVTAAGASATFIPVPRVTTRLTIQHAAFTDSNRRNVLAGYARWAAPVRRPKVGVSWMGRYQSCEGRDPDQPNTGYFCPDTFTAHVGGVDLGDRIGRRFGWNAQGTLGYQRADIGTSGASTHTDTVHGYRLTATWDFDSGVTLEAYAGRTDLALAAGSGYSSTESGFRVRFRIGALRRVVRPSAAPAQPPEGSSAGGEAH